MTLACLVLVASLCSVPAVSAAQSITVTGSITGTLPWELDYEPAPSAYTLPMPDFSAKMYDLVSIAWYWFYSTWLDGDLLDYWLLYQVGVAMMGAMIGNITGKVVGGG